VGARGITDSAKTTSWCQEVYEESRIAKWEANVKSFKKFGIRTVTSLSKYI